MELRHHISSLPNHVHEQTGNILNVHVQTGTAAAATGLTNDAHVQTGNILWDDGQTSLGKHLGRLYGTLLAFPLLILFLLHLGVFTTIAVIERVLNHLHCLRV
jgi:hypothetical protein